MGKLLNSPLEPLPFAAGMGRPATDQFCQLTAESKRVDSWEIGPRSSRQY